MSKYEINKADAQKLKPIALTALLTDVPFAQLEGFLVDLEALEPSKLRDVVMEHIRATMRYRANMSDRNATQMSLSYHIVSSTMMNTIEV